MSLNVTLAGCIEGAQLAAENATKELIKVTKRYELTPDGIEGEKQRLYAEVKEKAEAAKEKASELIEKQIAVIDAMEARETEKRAADTDYMKRLQMKLQMVGSVDLQEISDATLKALFEEFEGDTLAISMIRKAIPGPRALRVEPANENGKRQKHLQDVKAAIFRAIEKGSAYISPVDLESGNIPWKSEVDALRKYIVLQSENFSVKDAEVWAKVVSAAPEYEVDAKAWQMRFSN